MKQFAFSLASALYVAGFALSTSSCKDQVVESPSPELAADTPKPYPLEVCLVSGEKLGSMGEPTSLIHEGQEIKFCCDSCEPRFKKDPAKYLSKLVTP